MRGAVFVSRDGNGLATTEPTELAATALRPHLMGLARMAVFLVDAGHHITRWNYAAKELFGYAPSEALGERLDDLLAPSGDQRPPITPISLLEHPWSGFCPVRRGNGGQPIDTLWWLYPLTGLAEATLLAVAADARHLRELGPGLAYGDQILTAPRTEPGGIDRELNIAGVRPTMVSVPRHEEKRFASHLGEVLPLLGPDLSGRIVAQVLRHGYPTLSVDLCARLPCAPYWGSRQDTAGSDPRNDDATSRPPVEGAEAVLEMAAARERLSFLNEASARVGSSLELQRTVDELTEVLVPRFADFAGVQLLEEVLGEDGMASQAPGAASVMRRVAVTHNDEPGRWDDVVPVGELLQLPADTPFVACMTRGKPINIGNIDRRLSETISAQFDDRDLRPLLSEHALLVVPLIARGNVLGNVILLRRGDRPAFEEMDVATAEELARRAAVCMENAVLYRRELRIADTLQRTMLPGDPPKVAGVEIAYRHLPGNKSAQVGGDWFDAIRLPGNRVALVIGDVMGHGQQSAGVMGQFRTVVRTLAELDLPADQVLRQLDDVAQRLGESHLATCVYLVYDPVSRQCEVANAGHVPPVVVHPDGSTELLELPPGAPIGVGGVAFETARYDVPDGSQLLLCTDGLVEGRRQDLGDGLAILCETLAGRQRSLDATCDSLVEALRAEERHDDVALLMVRFEGIPHDDVASWTLEREATAVREARVLTRTTLADWDLDNVADTVVLLVSELVTNAVRHAAGPIELRMLRATTLLCEVADRDNQLPNMCEIDELDEFGRGLRLVDRLTQRWGTCRTGTGKVVWFEHALGTEVSRNKGIRQ